MKSWKTIDIVFGSDKELLSPRYKLMVYGAAQFSNVQSLVQYHSAIQAPHVLQVFADI